MVDVLQRLKTTRKLARLGERGHVVVHVDDAGAGCFAAASGNESWDDDHWIHMLPLFFVASSSYPSILPLAASALAHGFALVRRLLAAHAPSLFASFANLRALLLKRLIGSESLG